VTDEALERAEPIRAYRAWRHRPPAQSARLESFGGQTTWTPKRWMRAECKVMRAMGTHAAPASGCSCGIYATKDLALVAGLRLLAVVGNETSVMIGIVELAGTIIEHDFGYRAEYARVAALLPRPGQESAAEWIAAVYGVPVSSQLIDQWDDLPQPTPSAKARIPPLVSASVIPAPRPTPRHRGKRKIEEKMAGRWKTPFRSRPPRRHAAGFAPVGVPGREMIRTSRRSRLLAALLLSLVIRGGATMNPATPTVPASNRVGPVPDRCERWLAGVSTRGSRA